MMLFCPSDGNLLTVLRLGEDEFSGKDLESANKCFFRCRTCPYQQQITRRWTDRKIMEAKEVDDVLGGSESWKNVDKTEIACNDLHCENREAYFRQVQIRSADEPMTSFYKCTKCGTEWREN